MGFIGSMFYIYTSLCMHTDMYSLMCSSNCVELYAILIQFFWTCTKHIRTINITSSPLKKTDPICPNMGLQRVQGSQGSFWYLPNASVHLRRHQMPPEQPASSPPWRTPTLAAWGLGWARHGKKYICS